MNVTLHKGYRYRIDDSWLTDEQIHQIRSQIGSRRYMWNQYAAWLDEHPDAKYTQVPSYKEFTPSMSWAHEIDSCVFDNAKRDFKKALKDHRKNPGHFGKPKRKKKRSAKKSFKTTNNNHSIWLRGSKLKIPRIGEPLRIVKHRCLPPGHRITSVVIEETPSGKFFATVQFKVPAVLPERSYVDFDQMTALDYSSPDFYVDEHGSSPDTPHAYRAGEDKLSSAMSERDRKEKGSKNKNRARRRVARRSEDIANVRKDFTEQESAAIVKQHSIVFVENLNLANIARSLKLGKSTADNGFGMFRDQLAYKLGDNGGLLVKVPRHFPSSKLCSHCGHKLGKLALDEREWVCPNCGTHHRRDPNAAANLKEYGLFALMASGYVAGVADENGEYYGLRECFGVGSPSPDWDGLLCLARGHLPVPAGGTPVVTYAVDVLKAGFDDKEQRVMPVCLSMDYAGAFIASKRNSVATVTEAPTSAAHSAASRG